MTTSNLTPQINRTVARLSGHIPFNPDHSEIYEEKQQETFLHANTAAAFLLGRVNVGEPSLIILTGDAGHGKTHLVRHLMVSLGVPEGEVMEALQNRCNGEPFEVDGHRIAIHKDLSELTPGDAAELLGGVEALGCPLVVCVNEGRLRALLSQEGMRGTELAERILEGLQADQVEPMEGVLLLNLNWQMVSLPGGIMEQLLRAILHGNRWRTCRECSCRAWCPIYANRNILASEAHGGRVEVIRRLYEAVELLGEVVTIRQVLIHLAYLMTGNASCEDVHGMEREKGLAAHAHTSTLFGAGAPESFVESHGLFDRLQRLDPAYCATRKADERLQDAEHRERIVPEGAPDRYVTEKGYRVDLRKELSPRDLDLDVKRHVEVESTMLRRTYHILRRHALLESEDAVGVAGFEYIDGFVGLLEGSMKPLDRRHYIGLVINGLHRLQHLPSQKSNVYIVDPVSLRARAETAVISVVLARRDVKLVPEVPPVEVDGEAAIDARPRRLLLKIREHTLPLTLLDFEFLCRCAAGLASREFFTHTVRRLTNFLLRVAENEPVEDRRMAQVFFRGELLTISVLDGIVASG